MIQALAKSRKRISASLALLLTVGAVLPAVPAAYAAADGSGVLISQVYGGGGNNGAEFKNDFIELFNPTDHPVSLEGWSVQWTSASGTSYQATPLTGSIGAKSYYLVQEGKGTGGTLELPAPDSFGTLTMGAGSGKVALVTNGDPITGKADPDVMDFVGYGSANESESSPTPAPSATLSVIRQELPAGGGRGLDTDNNSTDFATGTPAPRNSSYGKVVADVTAKPGAGAVPPGTQIQLQTSTVGASVYYSVYAPDGSVKNGLQPYAGAISVNEAQTIKAYASKPGFTDSPVAEYAYTLLAKTDLAAARLTPKSQYVWTEGVVTHIDGQEMYIQDDTGAIVLYSFPSFAKAGDRVSVSGVMDIYNNLQEIKPVTGFAASVVTPDAGIPAPKLLTAADLAAGQGEQHEAELVYLENVTIDAKSGSTVTASQGGQTFTIYSGLSKLEAGKTFARITGVVKQFNAVYQLIPLGESSIVEELLSVTASPPAGRIIEGSSVTLASPMTGAVVHYTLDGSEPTAASPVYSGPIPVSQNVTVKAVAIAGGQTSSVYSFAYVASEQPRIRDIQGLSHTSEYAGQEVKDIEGIVTQYGYTFANGAYKGFFIQDPTPDQNPATSEGIFVFTTNEAAKPAIGDLVKVSGTVAEYNEGSSSNLTSTQITGPTVTVVSSGNPLPAPVVLGKNGRVLPTSVIDNDGMAQYQPEEDAIDFYESLEGMLVKLPSPVITSPYWTSGSGNTLVYNIATRVDNTSPDILTSAGGLVLKGSGNLNPQRLLIAYGDPGQEVGTGDRFTTDVTGVIGYNNGNYKVIPPLGGLPTIQQGTFQQETTTLVQDAGKLTIASYNVENFNPGVGAEKINKIADSIVHNLKQPDILGLVEMQDNSGETDNGVVDADASYQALIQAVKAAGGPDYKYTDVAPVNNQDGGAPGGNIRVGFLYNPARVTLSASVNGTKGGSTDAVAYDGANGRLTYNPGRIDPTNSAFSRSRKPLAAQFEFQGESVIVIANHFNSKSGDNGPFGSTQPPVLSSETQRHQIADVVNGFVKGVLAANPEANIVALGDLNDFQFTQTVTRLKGQELDDLIDKLPLNERYTYTFDGNAQVLDHILVSKKLTPMTAVDIVHLNADFPHSRGRVSDHDAVLAQLNLKGDTFTILHTNDTHANLDTSSAPDTILRRITAVKNAQASTAGTLLVDAGDVFSGTLYFNKYEGQADLEFMNLAGYDAMTFGNHEFDKGSEVLGRFIDHAKFPFVSANADFSKDAILGPKFVGSIGQPGMPGSIYPALVKRMGDGKVGIFGLTTEDTANISSPGDVTFQNAVEKAKATVAALQAQGINRIVLLSHLGYDEDVKLAQQVEGIDVIVGGHTHTKLDQPVVDRTHSAPTLIVQTGEKGQYLGKLQVTFDAQGVLTDWNGGLISIEAKNSAGAYVLASDPEAKAILGQYKPGVESLLQLAVGETEVALDGLRENVRTKETNLGNLIADGMLKAAQAAGTGAVMALQNGGGIRSSIPAGTITQGQVMTVLPFNNDLVTITLTGQEIKEALENGVSKLPAADGRFPQVAGLKFTYDSSKPAGERVKSIQVKNGGTYAPIDLSASYVMATNAFTAKGGDFYSSLEKAYKEGRVNLLYLPDYDVFTNYLKSGKVTASTSPVEGRIVDVAGQQPEGNIKLQLLSVNDLHGKINDSYTEKSLNVDVNGDGVISPDVLVGGMDYMAYAMKQREAANPNTLIVHAGDMVGGSPPVSALFQDEPVVEIMEAMGFDVGVVGNHEFDEGRKELLRLVNGGDHPNGKKGYDGQNFPLLAANVVDKTTGEPILPAYTVKEVEGVKVGFIGVITLETPDIVMPAGIQTLRFTDPAVAVNKAAAELKAQGVKALVVLAHIPASQSGDAAAGDAADLANAVDDEVDVIFAAHNHLRVNGMVDGKLIVQAWEYGKAFADVDLELDRTTGDIVSKKAELVYNVHNGYDPAVRAIIQHYSELAAPYLNRVIGTAAVEMSKDYPGVGIGGYGDKALGNLIADGMKAEMNADFALMNGGGVRENLNAGEITWGELFGVQPFNNVLVKLEVTGADMEAILNGMLGSGTTYGPDSHVAGLKYTWYRDAQNNRKVVDMVLPNGKPVDKNATYTLVVNNFMHTSTAPKYVELGKRGKNPVTGPEDLTATVNYVKSFSGPITYVPEGRIKEIAPPASEPSDDSSDTPAPSNPAPSNPAPAAPPAGAGVVTPVATDTGVELKIDPKGLKTETGADGKTMTVLTVNADALTKALEMADGAKKNIVLDLGAAGGVKVGLPASALAGSNGDILSIRSGGMTYDLPVGILNAGSLGSNAVITVSIAPVSGTQSEQLKKAAGTAGAELLADGVSYTITAQTGGGQSEINGFGSNYVTRTITINRSVDGSGATAVVFDPATGELSFVPAVFETANGKTVVRIIRNSNSIYTVVQADKTFADLKGHWARNEVELLASKLLVKGQTDTAFAPDAAITRAEFAALLVRALGLKPDAAGASTIADVKSGEWYAGAIGAAVKAGVMKGFEDGTFRPNASITREEMAVMIARALAAAGKGEAQTQTDASRKFADGSQIQAWALDSVGRSAAAGIVNGTADNRFQPSAQATRAEAAVMLKRFLQYVGFMN
ncbi:5'-nucleotidase C-terminal domain-containing protein [Gorillibacterium sp. sgz5001074]|uniref:5'-nucleotidase C-terminal domain-containing protein n=1 Tax=Gorillibacterium sp. sgz5001074 TaxID=3446695 RepID=UPI003F67F134